MSVSVSIDPMSIPAIIMAAGLSRRMGRVKALLTLRGSTFIERILSVCHAAGLSPVTVIRKDGVELAGKLKELELAGLGCLIVENPYPESQMLDSFILGVSAFRNAFPSSSWANVLVWPVDVPAVRLDTVELLVRTARLDPHRTIIPCFDGKDGHPTYLPEPVVSRALSMEIGAGGSNRAVDGLRGLVRGSNTEISRLSVDDPAVTLNLNTPSDLTILERIMEKLKC